MANLDGIDFTPDNPSVNTSMQGTSDINFTPDNPVPDNPFQGVKAQGTASVPPTYSQRVLNRALSDISGKNPDLTIKVGNYLGRVLGRVGTNIGSDISNIPSMIKNVFKSTPGVASALWNKPGNTVSDALNTIAVNTLNAPRSIAQGLEISKNAYTPFTNPSAGTPGSQLANFGWAVAPTGIGTKFLEKAAIKHIGDNALARGIGLTAGGAAVAPLYGQTPLQGVSAGLLGSVPLTAGAAGKALVNKWNKPAQALSNLAPVTPEDLPTVTRNAYQAGAQSHIGLMDAASNEYNDLTDNPVNHEANSANLDTFYKKVNELKDQLSKRENTPEIQKQIAVLDSFNKENTPLNTFNDVMNADRQINSIYKNYDLQANKGLGRVAAQLKGALQSHSDDMSEYLPPDSQKQYANAKTLYKQAKSMETFPNSRKISPWYSQFSKETNPRAVANGDADQFGVPIGDPGNFVQNSLRAPSGQKNTTARINHLLNYVAPNQKSSLASAYLNPFAKRYLERDEVANKLNGLEPAARNQLFGDNNPDVDVVKNWANQRHGSMARVIAGLAGMAELGHFGHPFIGYYAGSHLVPYLQRNSLSTSPSEPGLIHRSIQNSLKGLGKSLQVSGTQNKNQLGNTP